MEKSTHLKYKDAIKLPKGGAVKMDKDNFTAQASEMISAKQGTRPEAIYNWANKHNVDLVKYGYVLADIKSNDELLEDVLEDKFDAVKTLIDKVESERKNKIKELKDMGISNAEEIYEESLAKSEKEKITPTLRKKLNKYINEAINIKDSNIKETGIYDGDFVDELKKKFGEYPEGLSVDIDGDGMYYLKFNTNTGNFEVSATVYNNNVEKDKLYQFTKKEALKDWFEGKKYESGNRVEFIYETEIKKALKNKAFQSDISKDLMTKERAIEIIKSAGLDVPYDISGSKINRKDKREEISNKYGLTNTEVNEFFRIASVIKFDNKPTEIKDVPFANVLLSKGLVVKENGKYNLTEKGRLVSDEYFNIDDSELKSDVGFQEYRKAKFRTPNGNEILLTLMHYPNNEKLKYRLFINENPDQEFETKESADEIFDNLNYNYLDRGYLKVGVTTEEMLSVYPIVLEWSEGLEQTNIGFNYIYELANVLKKIGMTKTPDKTVIKNKVWFRDYPHYVNIENGTDEKDGNYNTELHGYESLNDWLKKYDPKFDWSIYDYGDNYKFAKEYTPKSQFKEGDLVKFFTSNFDDESVNVDDIEISYDNHYGYVVKANKYVKDSKRWKPYWSYTVKDKFDDSIIYDNVMESRMTKVTDEKINKEITDIKIEEGTAELLTKEEAENLSKEYIEFLKGDNNGKNEKLHDWFGEVISRYPIMLVEWQNAQLDYLPKKEQELFEYIYNGELPNLKQFFNSLMKYNVGKKELIGLYELISERLVNDKLPKKVDFKLHPTDKGLSDIFKKIVSDDDLRPKLTGIYFDEKGIVGTDAQKLVFISGKHDVRGIFGIGKNAGNVIDDVYPKYQAVIPKEVKYIVSIDRKKVEDILVALKTIKNVNYHSRLNYNKNKFSSDAITISLYKGEGVHYDINYLIELLDAWLKIGFDKLEFSYLNGVKNKTVLFISPNIKKFIKFEGSGSIIMAKMRYTDVVEFVIPQTEMYIDVPNGKAETAGITDDLYSELNLAFGTVGAIDEKSQIEELETLVELLKEVVSENPKDLDSKDALELYEETLVELKKVNAEKFEKGGRVGCGCKHSFAKGGEIKIGDNTNVGIVEDKYGDQFKVNGNWYHKSIVAKEDKINDVVLGKTYNGIKVPETVNPKMVISAFSNPIDENKVDKYTNEMKQEMLQNDFPAITGFPIIINQEDIGENFLSGEEITEDYIGKQAWKVWDGHHRVLAALNAKLPYLKVRLERSSITNPEELFEQGGMIEQNGAKYFSKDFESKGNTWNILFVWGKFNYVSVSKKTNNPFRSGVGREFKNVDEAIAYYKNPDMKVQLIFAENEAKELGYVPVFENGGELKKYWKKGDSDYPLDYTSVKYSDINYDIKDFLNRTNKGLIITTKDNKKFKGSVGTMFGSLTFFPDYIRERDIDEIQIIPSYLDLPKDDLKKWIKMQGYKIENIDKFENGGEVGEKELYYAVYDDNTLGLLFLDERGNKRFLVLQGSTLRGSNYSHMSMPLYINEDELIKIRKATEKDFDIYRVSLPTDFNKLNSQENLKGMIKKGDIVLFKCEGSETECRGEILDTLSKGEYLVSKGIKSVIVPKEKVIGIAPTKINTIFEKDFSIYDERVMAINSTLFNKTYGIGENPFEVNYDESNEYGYGIYFLDEKYSGIGKYNQSRILSIKPNIKKPLIFLNDDGSSFNSNYKDAYDNAVKYDGVKSKDDFNRKMVELGYDSMVISDIHGIHFILLYNDPKLYELKSDVGN